MPDTTYSLIEKDTISLDSLQQVELKAIADANQAAYDKKKEQIAVYESIAFAIFAIALLVVAAYKLFHSKENGYYITRKKPWDSRYYDFRNEEDRYYEEYIPDEPVTNPDKKYLVYKGTKLGLSKPDIVAILQKHYPYYNNLNQMQKGKFTDRLQAFMQAKTFIIYSHEAFKEMPVLLSAAATQLTFGLEKYMLPYFKYLNIHPEEYFAENSLRVLAGNVYGDSITIAWNQFIKGFKNPSDGVNVGLHEMAHAVYYQHVIVDKKKEKDFCNCFNEVMEQGAEVYELKTTQHQLFTKNAFKDLQEFWAESVELFFERPMDLKNNYAELYEAISDLLNQNPCNGSNPVIGS